MTDSSIDTSRPAPARTGFFQSPAVKFFALAFLCGLLVVPLVMVWALTWDRSSRRDAMMAEVARDWGGEQFVQGPLLLVPFTRSGVVEENGIRRSVTEQQNAVFLPDDFKVDVTADTEIRPVSIYEAPVFRAKAAIAARFPAPDVAALASDLTEVHWDRAVLLVKVGDLTGVESVTFTLGNGRKLEVLPGPGGSLKPTYGGSLHAPLPADLLTGSAATGFEVALSLEMKGSGALRFAPIGRDSRIAIAGDWPHPSFVKGPLPSERLMEADRFTASWAIPFLARDVPQSWIVERDGADRFDPWNFDYAGVDFVDEADHYDLMERALKYAVMFMAAIFGVVFVLELLSPRRIHLVQYAIVGLIMVFFYVLLLALMEHVGFALAYLLASLATGGVIATFVALALGSTLRGAGAALAFGLLFGLLYVIMRLEDIALLAGAGVGFLLLTGALFATRKVDWSGNRPVSRPALESAGSDTI